MLTLAVEGMTCAHCAAAVTEAVSALPGVIAVAVDVTAGNVRIQGEPDLAKVRAAIAAEGYQVR